jgi:Na+/citrate or Na+/malate symporter
MLGVAARLLLTATALAPVLLTYGFTLIPDDLGLAALFMLGALILALLCVQLLQNSKERLEEVSVEIQTAEAADRENIAFLLLYISPLFTGSVLELNWEIWFPVIFIFIFGLVVATGYNYHFSPLLGLFGWHAYKVSTKSGITYVLLTRRQLRRALGSVKVRQLTEYVVIEFGR